MVVNNPYIEKVKSDADILHIVDDIYARQWKWSDYFGNKNEIILEIGTGMGNFFSKQVWKYSNKNFIWMEIRYKRLFQTAEKSRKNSPSIPLIKGEENSLPQWGRCLKGRGSKNNFVMLKDFAQNINKIFVEWEISETYIFFPDPWANKDRQRKHRLLQAKFLENLHTITKAGWKLFFKTDHIEYFDSTREILENQWLWKVVSWTHKYENSEIFDIENITEFEWFYRGEDTDINYIELQK